MVRIQNLEEADANGSDKGFDVCDRGRGGWFVSLSSFDAIGKKVICIEAGGRKCASCEETGLVPRFANGEYPGALVGRSFGIGSSTCRWGGLLAPHSEPDRLAAGNSRDSETWNYIVDAVSSHQQFVLSELGFDGPADFFTFASNQLPEDANALAQAGLGIVSSIFLPFKRKNLARLLVASGCDQASVLYTNAVAKEWCVDRSGQVSSVLAVSPNGRELRVEARRFVIASGAIECARILLEIQRTNDSPISTDTGHCLGDHLSIGIADVKTDSLLRVTSDYAPRFVGPWMRSFRFVESTIEPGTPRSFSHFVFENENPGFQLAKKVLTGYQARQFPQFSIGEIATGFGGITQLGINRFLRHKLFVPKATKTRLQLDIEQEPDVNNSVRLTDETDCYGRPTAEVAWKISDKDVSNLREAAHRLLKRWEDQGFRLPRLQPRDLHCDSSKPHDAYHPLGVCRMGTDPNAVVGLDCSVNGLANVSVISTALLPSAGTANPTFTMLCIAENFLEKQFLKRS